MRMHLEVTDLPGPVRRAVKACGKARGTVAMEPATKVYPYPADKGCRSVAVAVDLATGDTSHVALGSWGGVNPFESKGLDRGPVEVPPGFAVVSGQTGYRTYLTITVHPDSLAPLLPDGGPELTPDEQRVLDVHCAYNSRGRRDYFDRNPVENLEDIKRSLADKGLLKVARNGAATVTAKGRNARSGEHWY